MSNYDVFISYSRKDDARTDDADGLVTRMKTALEAAGLRVWMDDKLVSSAEWWAQIEAHIERSHNFLLFISEHSLASEWCQREIAHAFANGKRLIAFQLSAVDEKRVKGGWMDTAWEQIARANWEPLRKRQWITDHLGLPDFDAAVERIRTDAQTDPAYVEAHTRLLLQAQTWQNSGESPGAHISGGPLAEAERWLTAWDGRTLPAPTDLQRAFVSACRVAQTATEKEAAATEARARRLRRSTLIAGVIGLVAVLLAAGATLFGARAAGEANVAGTQVAEANAQLTAIPPTLEAVATQMQVSEDRIVSFDLASEAVTILNEPAGNYEVAALLGIRALQSGYTKQADAALVQATNGLYTHAVLRGHEGCSESDKALTPSPSPIAADGGERGAGILSCLGVSAVHSHSVNSAVYSPDGRFVLTASDETILLAFGTALPGSKSASCVGIR
jgi:hypothetical protein